MALAKSGENKIYAPLMRKATWMLSVFSIFVVITMTSVLFLLESMRGDANLVNQAGALRMQAMRVSRALLIHDPYGDVALQLEVDKFNKRFEDLKQLIFIHNDEESPVLPYFNKVETNWQSLINNLNGAKPHDFDTFVNRIDELVKVIEQRSEKKVLNIEIIQLLTLITFIVSGIGMIFWLRRKIVRPIGQLTSAARTLSTSHFFLPRNFAPEGEIAILFDAFEHMVSRLQQSYGLLENRVREKTEELQNKNQSLSFLFDISRELVAEQERWSISRLSSKVDALVTGSFVQIVHVNSDGSSQALKAHYEVIEFEIAGVPNKTLAWFVPNEATPKEWHLELLRSIADLVSLFMQVKNNKETEKRLLISEERAVIARELHDSLAQSLSYIKFQVSILESIMGEGSDSLKISECLSELRTSTSKAYEQLRNLLSTFRLRLEDMTFWEAVEQSADEFAKKGNISIRISRLLLFEHLDAKRETHLLQIIRECLSNVVKHAKAKNAQIVFDQKGRNLQVMVIDDGIGFTPQNNNQGHFGIAIIQERAEALGAKVKYLANKPSGTKVLVALQI